jgi:DNA-binding response OmpR family regulator
VVFLTRSAGAPLPTALQAGLDVKVEALGSASLDHLAQLGASAIVVDATEDPAAAFETLRTLRAGPRVVLIPPDGLEPVAWDEVADEVLLTTASAAETRLRLAMLARRAVPSGEGGIVLGPLTLDVDSYRVAVGGRVLDLTYREFELLRYLVERPGRVCTRQLLLREVWGYDFYGGTRTVDVHVRRLRAKLGPAHEGLIETVRSVGYRAAVPEPDGVAEPEAHDAAGPEPTGTARVEPDPAAHAPVSISTSRGTASMVDPVGPRPRG